MTPPTPQNIYMKLFLTIWALAMTATDNDKHADFLQFFIKPNDDPDLPDDWYVTFVGGAYGDAPEHYILPDENGVRIIERSWYEHNSDQAFIYARSWLPKEAILEVIKELTVVRIDRIFAGTFSPYLAHSDLNDHINEAARDQAWAHYHHLMTQDSKLEQLLH